MKTVKISITMPEDLVKELKHLTSNLSAYITAGMQEYVARDRARRGFKKSVGSWRQEDHPELQTITDITKYVEETRGGWKNID
ncbi:Post-segregation antitoxin CcdA [Moorella glycerini]|uniref:Post-segregation antitoxin CcdA n=3 Tax=Neomoorella TaxID=44260 RepID=A0A9X7J2S3_9FIRM|nr:MULTISPECIES: type II toxin-antitoxin system CcdA family antitoxin [Moorella]KYH32320.1 hypothetical protein MOMUL_15420 [Moorella mulderi DSM 14980]PRR71586.1 hypothetical protein MOST_23490 [Moorella stamsii]QGP90794.1 hypothetical protein MGLY_01050 [Moorella glycerini]CEP66143.1 Post-segregation antitoxin CcdA [Moorella glycerini]